MQSQKIKLVGQSYLKFRKASSSQNRQIQTSKSRSFSLPLTLSRNKELTGLGVGYLNLATTHSRTITNKGKIFAVNRYVPTTKVY